MEIDREEDFIKECSLLSIKYHNICDDLKKIESLIAMGGRPSRLLEEYIGDIDKEYYVLRLILTKIIELRHKIFPRKLT